MKRIFVDPLVNYFWLIFISILLVVFACDMEKTPLHVFGKANNDLVHLLQKQRHLKVILHKSPLQAIEAVRSGDALLILATEYPGKTVSLSPSFFQQLKAKRIRAFIEYPSYLPGVKMGTIHKAGRERAVVTGRFFNGFPDSLSILGINGLHYVGVEVPATAACLVAATVAGFDSAIYGLPQKQAPLLFQLNDDPVLVATTKLSGFVSGRYAPAEAWDAIWKRLLTYLLPDANIEKLQWEPVVAPSYTKHQVLPKDVQLQSLVRAVQWYKKARMLIPASYTDTLHQLVNNGIQRMSWSRDIPVGNGSCGVFECIFSQIDENGSQPIGIMQRGDCTSETAMAFAAAGRVLNDQKYLNTAQNLLDYYLTHSIAGKNEYGNPEHEAYGLIPWGISTYSWYKANYGDDNARFLLAAWTASAQCRTNRWDKVLMRSLLALLRTTGRNGFRGSRIDLPELAKNGREYYSRRKIVNLSPHFESYLWACYLWAYDKTGEELFRKKAESGIKTMMQHYPHGWRWTNGLAQERARMILPLAWLLRINDTSENREMLDRIVTDFLKLQQECGAIREELGDIEKGKYPPPQSNEAYGTNEASLIARNDDPVSDLLYTTNFALLGLHEAAYATGDATIKKATDKLAEFLCRIQIKSAAHPQLDGGWMRAFDFQRFEYWGSNADHGWGAWVIESGWTQGWITALLALRRLDISIWELTRDSKIARHYSALRTEMLP